MTALSQFKTKVTVSDPEFMLPDMLCNLNFPPGKRCGHAAIPYHWSALPPHVERNGHRIDAGVARTRNGQGTLCGNLFAACNA